MKKQARRTYKQPPNSERPAVEASALDHRHGAAAGYNQPAGVSLRDLRDTAWRAGSAQPHLSGDAFVNPEAVKHIVTANATAEDADRREHFLRLIARPVSQRERIQEHWNGDTSNVEETRKLYSEVLVGEVMNAISYPKPALEETHYYPFLETAIRYAKDTIAAMNPADPMERMLVEQSLLLHFRFIRLATQAAQSTGADSVRILNEAADRCANTYRRHMLALKDYRAIRRPRVFMPIRSAHIGSLTGQQVIASGTTPALNGFSRFLALRRTRRNAHAIRTTRVPAICSGTSGETGT